MEPSPPELMHSPHSSTPYRAPAESFRGAGWGGVGGAGENKETGAERLLPHRTKWFMLFSK